MNYPYTNYIINIHSISISASPRISPKYVEKFHKASLHDNKLLVLCSKLVVLACVGSVTSFASLVIFTLVSDVALLIDVVCNVSVLWLNFKFSEYWFFKCQCYHFHACTFPILKTCALSGDLKHVCCNCCCNHTQTRSITRSHSPSATPSHLKPDILDRTSTMSDLQIVASISDKDGMSVNSLDLKVMNSNISQSSQSRSQEIDSQFSFSFDSMEGNKNLDGSNKNMKEHTHCCSCCCTMKARNLYYLSIQEYAMYIKDDFDCKCDQSDLPGSK